MINRIESGSLAPCQCSDALPRESIDRRTTARRVAGAVILIALAASNAYARDRGQFANSAPETRAWFERLRSGKGPCCSDADGSVVSDVDWETREGHYRVRVDGQWFDVPDDAVITEPNRIGRTMVWPIQGYLGLTIRCFMPGSMT